MRFELTNVKTKMLSFGVACAASHIFAREMTCFARFFLSVLTQFDIFLYVLTEAMQQYLALAGPSQSSGNYKQKVIGCQMARFIFPMCLNDKHVLPHLSN